MCYDAKIDKKVDDVKKEMDTQKMANLSKEKVQGVDDKLSEGQIDLWLQNCKNMEEIENALEKVKIKKREEIEDGVDGFFCEICFDGSDPDWKSKTKISGVFRLEKEEQLEGEKEKQSQSQKPRTFNCTI